MDLTLSLFIYDNENYIKESNNMLNCIRNNLKNYKQLILLDDRRNQSKELDKILNLKDLNYKIVKHGENKGVLQGYISSVEQCETTWLWMIDTDDIVTEFDFDKLNDVPDDSQAIYFKQQDNLLNNIYDKNLYFNIINMKINDMNERKFLYQYSGLVFFTTFWFKIVNANSLKQIIHKNHLNDYCENFRFYSSDTILNIYLVENINKISLVNYELPYIHDSKNSYKYSPYLENGDINYDVDEECIKSWIYICKNFDFNLKEIFKKIVKNLYLGIDFEKYDF